MLAFNDVSLSYEPASRDADKTPFVLQDLNLNVPPGQSLAIIGPSGCGKSSLLRLAAGLVAPSSGKVLIRGERLDKPRRQTALILQNYGLLPWKTVYTNVELGLRIQKMPKSERAARVNEALKCVGLKDVARSYPAQLSGGMQQRTALARALAQDADMLLMDEPTSALDTLLREELQDALLELWKRKRYTQIIVTHSLEEAVYLGQRIIVMSASTKSAPSESPWLSQPSCPGHIATCIENPLMGSREYRSSREFFEQCNVLRNALEGARPTAPFSLGTRRRNTRVK